MKLFKGITLIAVGALILVSCNKDKVKPSSTITKENRTVEAFNSIDISSAIDVEFVQATVQGIEVEANENLHKFIEIDVKSNTLVIKMKNNLTINGSPTITVHVENPLLYGVECSGASSFDIIGEFTADAFDISCSGASEVFADINVLQSEIEMSGASNVELTGYAANVIADLSGASSLERYSLDIDDLKIELSGASQANLTVNNTIEIDASGASALRYKGNAVITSLNISGDSEVEKVD